MIVHLIFDLKILQGNTIWKGYIGNIGKNQFYVVWHGDVKTNIGKSWSTNPISEEKASLPFGAWTLFVYERHIPPSFLVSKVRLQIPDPSYLLPVRKQAVFPPRIFSKIYLANDADIENIFSLPQPQQQFSNYRLEVTMTLWYYCNHMAIITGLYVIMMTTCEREFHTVFWHHPTMVSWYDHQPIQHSLHMSRWYFLY